MPLTPRARFRDELKDFFAPRDRERFLRLFRVGLVFLGGLFMGLVFFIAVSELLPVLVSKVLVALFAVLTILTGTYLFVMPIARLARVE